VKKEPVKSAESSTPFDSIEGAQEYLRMLADTVTDASRAIGEDIDVAVASNARRQVDALRLVDYKLGQLQGTLTTSRRILTDLRTLRRLILSERRA
jgi:hypothetical protein